MDTDTAGRSALGPADVSDAELASMLGVDEILTSSATTIDYDLDAMTTGGRWWVTGTARRADRLEQFRVVAKLAQSVTRSPIMASIPPEFREMAAANLPWRVEPDVYRSDLASHLPDGLRMPDCLCVREVDDESSAVWIEAVDVIPAQWTLHNLRDTARLLGRFAATTAVQDIADDVGHVSGPRQARVYFEGRLRAQYVAAYSEGSVFDHPAVAPHFTPPLRTRLMSLVDHAPSLIDEIEALLLLAAHGDACPNNLLTDAGGTVAIDWAFFGRGRIGFDLSQLLLSDIELGRIGAGDLPTRRDASLDGYRAGLADGGVDITPDALRRAHAIQAAIAIGVAAVPLEHLDEPADTLDTLVREHVVMLDHLLAAIGI